MSVVCLRGKYMNMKKPKITLEEISKELGISQTTISRAISGKGRVSADTKERVFAYLE
ncbi:MAG: LacI family DNA-binding transcriptional regulator, partial [Tyzzerella sp.]|nr:LacI family DNA-binding transcriptional regulator [Tyzzerella sp.]